MAYGNSPVKIPKATGKITFRKMTDKTYVLYETGRVYNPTKKSNTPKRTMIGLQIRNAPTLMLPNENYEKYFGKDGEEKMTAKERAAAENYEITCNDNQNQKESSTMETNNKELNMREVSMKDMEKVSGGDKQDEYIARRDHTTKVKCPKCGAMCDREMSDGDGAYFYCNCGQAFAFFFRTGAIRCSNGTWTDIYD